MTPRHAPDPIPSVTIRGVVRATVDIAAPPARVFQALTDPAELAAWWGRGDPASNRPNESTAGAEPGLPATSHAGEAPMRDWCVDARPGGRWCMPTHDAGGRAATVQGTYRIVDPPRVLESTWRASWEDDESFVRYELTPIEIRGEPATRLTVTHTGASVCAHAVAAQGAAWSRCLRDVAHQCGTRGEVDIEITALLVHFGRSRLVWPANRPVVARTF